MAMQAFSLKRKLNAFVANWAYPFTINMDMINFREMRRNYPDEAIPTEDILSAVNAILGTAPIARASFDPRPLGWVNPTVQACVGKYEIPTTAWVEPKDMMVLVSCNRNIIPRHIAKHERIFTHMAVATIYCIKCPITGKYIIWDGNHTSMLCLRQGYTHLKISYIQADPNDSRDPKIILKELVKKAAICFKIINGSGKKKIDTYDSHLIMVDTGFEFECAVQAIFDKYGVIPVKNKTFKQPRALGHIDSAYEGFNKTAGKSVSKGEILDRSLKFITKYWPEQPVDAYLLTAMASIYESGFKENNPIPLDWDDELGPILCSFGEDSAKLLVQKLINKYVQSQPGYSNTLRCVIRDGILLVYSQTTGEDAPVQPAQEWNVL